MHGMRFVWVLEEGGPYGEDWTVRGIYATAESAMSKNPRTDWQKDGDDYYKSRYATLQRYEVQD